jgi:hypothetical protein
MSSKSEIARRKLLRQEIEKHARAEAEAKMPISKQQLASLFDHLDHALSQGCDHSHRHTQEFLRSQALPESTIIPWLGEYGGYCDCEVLANVEEHWS